MRDSNSFYSLSSWQLHNFAEIPFRWKIRETRFVSQRGFHADCQCQISKYMNQKSIKIFRGRMIRTLWNY